MSNPSSTPTLKALRETLTARIYAVGASATPLVELLGAVLGNPDTALAELNQFPTLEDIAHASNAELEDIAGIGKSSAARIRAALELGRRLVSTMPHERPSMTSPADAANLVIADSQVAGLKDISEPRTLCHVESRCRGNGAADDGAIQPGNSQVGIERIIFQ